LIRSKVSNGNTNSLRFSADDYLMIYYPQLLYYSSFSISNCKTQTCHILLLANLLDQFYVTFSLGKSEFFFSYKYRRYSYHLNFPSNMCSSK